MNADSVLTTGPDVADAQSAELGIQFKGGIAQGVMRHPAGIQSALLAVFPKQEEGVHSRCADACVHQRTKTELGIGGGDTDLIRQDHVAFFTDRVTLEINGEKQDPQAPGWTG